MLARPERGLCPVAQAQFAQDARYVVLDGAFGDEERLADLAVTRSARELLKDLDFALGQGVFWRESRCELIRSRGLLAAAGCFRSRRIRVAGESRHELGRDRGLQGGLVALYRVDGFDQLACGHILEQVAQ